MGGNTGAQLAVAATPLTKPLETPVALSPSEAISLGIAGGGPTEVWGVAPSDKGQGSGTAARDCLVLETYKRGTLGHSSMVTRATGLSNLIPREVKQHIWRKEFIDIFTLLKKIGRASV